MYIKAVNFIRYRRLFFSASDCFLSGSSRQDCDINYFIQVPANVDNALQEFYTLITDLEQPTGTIWQGIYHRTRSEINSFINNQAYEHQVVFSPAPDELKTFIKLFNEFAALKKIRKAEVFRLQAYNRHGILAVSFIKQQGIFTCINFYRVTAERATNLYSFNLQHQAGNPFNNSHMGRAHRSLHWLDMLEFKKMSVRHYDFCGWYAGTEDKARLNINAFKEQFTKNKVKEYSGVIYKNKLLLWLLKLAK